MGAGGAGEGEADGWGVGVDIRRSVFGEGSLPTNGACYLPPRSLLPRLMSLRSVDRT